MPWGTVIGVFGASNPFTWVLIGGTAVYIGVQAYKNSKK